MKISELIAELEKAMAEHGDLEAHAFACDAETSEPVTEVYLSMHGYVVVSPW